MSRRLLHFFVPCAWIMIPPAAPRCAPLASKNAPLMTFKIHSEVGRDKNWLNGCGFIIRNARYVGLHRCAVCDDGGIDGSLNGQDDAMD